MEGLPQKVLGMFGYLNKDVLDLHELFEAGGNDPGVRSAVVDTVERLVKERLLEERGSDFYALAVKGKESVQLEPGY
jgi:hypothetical protein